MAVAGLTVIKGGKALPLPALIPILQFSKLRKSWDLIKQFGESSKTDIQEVGMSLRTNLIGCVISLCVFSLCLCGVAMAKTTIKIAYENNPGEPIDVVAHKWADLVKQKSNGDVELELYPSSQLGSKKDVLEMAMMGVNVVTITDAGFLADYVPDFSILVGPYLAKNAGDIFKLFKTDWFKGLEKQLQAKGLHIVTPNLMFGIRHLLTTKPVKTPEDLKGMKVRVPNNRMQIATLKAMGATPTPMPFSEVYPGLTQGVIDGAENTIPVIYGQKLYEAAPCLNLIGYMTMTAQWIGGQAYFDTLSPKVVQMLRDTGDEAGLLSQKLLAADGKEAVDLMKKMKAEGVKIVHVDPTPFREATKEVYKEFPEWTPGLYEKVQSLLEN